MLFRILNYRVNKMNVYKINLYSGKKKVISFDKYHKIAKIYFSNKFLKNEDKEDAIQSFFFTFKKLLDKKFNNENHFQNYFNIRLQEVYREALKSKTGLNVNNYKQYKIIPYENIKYKDSRQSKDQSNDTIDLYNDLFLHLNFIPLKYAYPLYYRTLGIDHKRISKAFGISLFMVNLNISIAKKLVRNVIKKLDNKQITNDNLPFRGKRFIFLTKKEALKRLKVKERNLKIKYKNKKVRIPCRPALYFKQHISNFIKNPEKIKNQIRRYRLKNKDKINKQDRLRSKTKRRIEWRKEWSNRPDIKKRIKLMDSIRYIRGRLRGSTKKGFYKNNKYKNKAIKRLDYLLILYGKDRRYK